MKKWRSFEFPHLAEKSSFRKLVTMNFRETCGTKNHCSSSLRPRGSLFWKKSVFCRIKDFSFKSRNFRFFEIFWNLNFNSQTAAGGASTFNVITDYPLIAFPSFFLFFFNSKLKKRHLEFHDFQKKSWNDRISRNPDFFQNNEPRGLKLEEQWFLVPQVSRKFIVTSFRKLDFSAIFACWNFDHFFTNNAQFSKNACSFRLCALHSCILHAWSKLSKSLWVHVISRKCRKTTAQFQNHHFVILSSPTAEHAYTYTLHDVYVCVRIVCRMTLYAS